MPLSLVVNPENRHDGEKLIEVVSGMRVKHGVGRPTGGSRMLYANLA
jgi:hypothetical protein